MELCQIPLLVIRQLCRIPFNFLDSGNLSASKRVLSDFESVHKSHLTHTILSSPHFPVVLLRLKKMKAFAVFVLWLILN